MYAISEETSDPTHKLPVDKHGDLEVNLETDRVETYSSVSDHVRQVMKQLGKLNPAVFDGPAGDVLDSSKK